MSRCVVIDANRIFSELIGANHKLRQTFASEPETEFLCPKYVLVELFKHKERIAKSTGLDEANLLALLYSLLERIRFFDQDAISIGSWVEAWRLCRDVDENDVAYVALTLEVAGDLWTSDGEFGSRFAQEGLHALFRTMTARPACAAPCCTSPATTRTRTHSTSRSPARA